MSGMQGQSPLLRLQRRGAGELLGRHGDEEVWHLQRPEGLPDLQRYRPTSLRPRPSQPLLSDGAQSARQRTMIAALLTVLSALDLDSVSPALAVAFTECVSALAD